VGNLNTVEYGCFHSRGAQNNNCIVTNNFINIYLVVSKRVEVCDSQSLHRGGKQIQNNILSNTQTVIKHWEEKGTMRI
jgi:hypothetical protein